MEIPFDGALTREEYFHLVKLSNRPLHKKGTSFIDQWVILVTLGGILLVIAVGTFITRFDDTFIWMASLAVSIVLLRMGWQTRALPQKVWEANSALQAQREGMITDEAVQTRMPTGDFRFLWTDLSGFGEGQDLVALFQGTAVCLPFPKRFFHSTEA